MSRLVALNAQRVSEEKAGLVRWLRPAFQHPAAAAVPGQATQSLSNQELLAPAVSGLQADSLPAIEAALKGKGQWKKGLPRILETLEVLGRARREGAGGEVAWRG